MVENEDIILSPLPKTWIIDMDGTIVKHNGYLIDGKDTLLQPSVEFIRNISINDKIIILTARGEECRKETINFLIDAGIRFDEIIFNMPTGERILINDIKPSGLSTALAVNVKRDSGIKKRVIIDLKK